MNQSRTLSMGMDGHTDTMAVAYVATAHDAEVVFLGGRGTATDVRRGRLRARRPLSRTSAAAPGEGPCRS
jgi:hypothetical protein